MSTFTQTEQATPSIPASTTQLLYPKVGGQFIMASDGVERQLLDTRSLVNTESVLNMYVNLFGGI
jgi:hypothetical protein